MSTLTQPDIDRYISQAVQATRSLRDLADAVAMAADIFKSDPTERGMNRFNRTLRMLWEEFDRGAMQTEGDAT